MQSGGVYVVNDVVRARRGESWDGEDVRKACRALDAREEGGDHDGVKGVVEHPSELSEGCVLV